MAKGKFKSILKMSTIDIIRKGISLCKVNLLRGLDLCAIMNARSGRCPGDCGYCAQSRVSRADIKVYDLISEDSILERARYAKEIGATRVSIVVSGLAASYKEVDRICRAVERIRREVGIKVCASLGMLEKDKLRSLKDAGLSRFHHNIETAPSFFSKIVSTHRIEDRIDTVLRAKDVGLDVCCGGIFGLGEEWEQRIEFFELLKDLEIKNVPLNFLIPIKGTPLGDRKLLSWDEALKIVFLAKEILIDACLRLCGGRELVFGERQLLPFLVGAEAMMIGGYLTRGGNPVEEDRLLKKEAEKIWHRIKGEDIEEHLLKEVVKKYLS